MKCVRCNRETSGELTVAGQVVGPTCFRKMFPELVKSRKTKVVHQEQLGLLLMFEGEESGENEGQQKGEDMKQPEAERLAEILENTDKVVSMSEDISVLDLAAELRRLVSFNQQLMDEVARLNQALTWEQNRSGRIGTHGPGCHTWGGRHYECLLRVNQELLEALKKISKIELQMYGPDWGEIIEAQTIADEAIAKAQP